MKRTTLSVFKTDNVFWVDFGRSEPVDNQWNPAARGRRRTDRQKQQLKQQLIRVARVAPLMAGLALAGCEVFTVPNDLAAPGLPEPWVLEDIIQ